MRAMAASALTLLSPEQWDRFGKLLRPGLPASLKMSTLGEKVHKLAAILDSNSQTELYQRLVSGEKRFLGHRRSGNGRLGRRPSARQPGTETKMLHDLVRFLAIS